MSLEKPTESVDAELSVEERARRIANLRQNSLEAKRRSENVEAEILVHQRAINQATAAEGQDKRLHREAQVFATGTGTVRPYESQRSSAIKENEARRVGKSEEVSRLNERIQRNEDAAIPLADAEVMAHLRPEADMRNMEVSLLKKAIELRTDGKTINSSEFQSRILGMAGNSKSIEDFVAKIEASKLDPEVTGAVTQDKKLLGVIDQFIQTKQ